MPLSAGFLPSLRALELTCPDQACFAMFGIIPEANSDREDFYMAHRDFERMFLAAGMPKD